MKAKNKLNKNLFVDIPNTEEGREAIKTIRKHINRDLVKTIRLRGRGSRVKVAKKLGRNPRAFDQSLPLEHSERVTLYLDYNKNNPSEYNVDALKDEIRNLEGVVKELENYKTLVESKMSTEDLLQYLQDTLPYVSRWQERCIKLSAIDLIGGLK
jgi:hypothetical protein